MANKHRNLPADAQFAEGGKTTPEQDASFAALMSELDEYRLGVAEGRIKPVALTSEQEILGRHMQA